MIHRYRLNRYNIVLDVASGSVHSTDEAAYEAIGIIDELCKGDADTAASELSRDDFRTKLLERMRKLLPEYPEEELYEVLSDIRELIGAGKLFAKDVYRDLAFDLKKRSPVVKALCLLVSHSCNLSCDYCFAAQGRFKGKSGLMSFETGRRALDFLVENSGTRKNLEVDFFGGEPLLNFEVIKRLVEYARSIEKDAGKNFRFTLTTNGIGLNDEVMEWANRECYNVVLSLDGRREVNDRFRVDQSGQGSYDRIVPKFQEFVRRRGGKGYYIRGTFTRHNTDFTRDIFHMADDLGFTELSMEPVVCAPSDENALREEDLPVLKEQYEILAKDMIRRRRDGRPITFYHYMIDLEEGPCIYKRISGCGSGTEYLAVTAWGELYPCHQFVNDPLYKMGDIWEGITDTGLQDRFKLCNVYSKPDCDNCFARLYCAGGCPANALHAAGDIHGTYEYGCELFRKRIECALMLKVDELCHTDLKTK
ncbi:MAG TPA: thioether cross-link-forming SCIFF peptide maturase [Lachnospiraceae bacterium]|nr:thioether cross-link-forming SCIFF peptide maturase [Lachnospiraceae bacterium]